MSKKPNCRDLLNKAECDANKKCFWGKDSQITEACGDASTDNKKANLVSIDLAMIAPRPLEFSDYQTKYPKLKDVSFQSERLIRLVRASKFPDILESDFFKNYIFNQQETQSQEIIAEFIKEIYRLPNMMTITTNTRRVKRQVKTLVFLKDKIKNIIAELNDPRSSTKSSGLSINNISTRVAHLPKVPPGTPLGPLPPEPGTPSGPALPSPGTTSGPTSGASTVPTSADGGEAPDGGEASTVPPPPDGGEASTVPTPGAGSPDGGAEGQIVYDTTQQQPDGSGDGSVGPVYATTDRERPPQLPPRKQPFNIEKEMINSGLKEQKFPGFWGPGGTPK